jgi:PEP-CTERM motif
MKPISSFIAAVAAAFAASSTSALAAICEPGQPCVVPEPGSLALVALAIAGVVLVARKKK